MDDGLSVPSGQLIIIVVLIFCRLGSCLMVMPGMSSARVPMQVRLFLAFALSFAMVPLVGVPLQAVTAHMNLARLVLAIVSELLTGALFGFLAQTFFWSLQFVANIIAMSIGYSGQPGKSVLESMPEAPLANLIVVGALMLFFLTNMHFVLLRGLVASYDAVPVRFVVEPQGVLVDAVDTLSAVFLTGLRIAAPFLLYAILVNFAAGLVNKLTPSIPVYFISLPFVIFGGLLLTFFLFPEILHFFATEMASGIEGGL